jgi:uncharacterized protein YbjT (DUF2867 family)
MTKKAIIVGGSGLIGSKLLNIIFDNEGYNQILLIARKKTRTIDNRVTQLVLNFEQLNEHAAEITGDVLFCCLGTTKNKTPDRWEYSKIEHDYPVKLAEIALKNKIEQYHLVSSVGANAKSSNFYLKMKGETEAELKKKGLRGLYIYQPSLLTGHRKTSRKMEKLAIYIMKVINPLLFGGLKKYRSIPANTVAMAMFKQSLKNEPGMFTYTSDKIKKLA